MQPAPHLLAVALFLAFAALGCGGSEGGSEPAGDAGPSLSSVAGEIRAAFGTARDSDVNEPSSPFAPNDDLASAQEIPNPVTLGGYVNQPGAGASGRSFADGDPRDLYRVVLAEGQSARLVIADAGADLDLALLELDETPVDSSDGDSPVEMLVAPASGAYLLEVTAFAGASNYVLSVGQTAAASAPASVSEFVPGEVIVRFRPGEAPSAAARRERVERYGLRMLARSPRGGALLGARDDDAELSGAFRALGIGHLVRERGARGRRDHELRRDTRRLAKALRGRRELASADLNYVRRPAAAPADELFSHQWHLPLVHLPEAWDNVEADSGVVVAVIDTGVVSAHPDLEDQLVAGYDFIQDPSSSRDGGGCDDDPEDEGDGVVAGNSSFHGTHVTGTVVARTSLQEHGDTGGVAGVAWNARVMPLRALGAGGGTDFDLIQALLYAAGLENECDVLPDERADVVNLSLGGPDPSAALDAAIASVRSAGVVVVAAAGNFGSSAPFYPASSAGVISVSAVAADATLASYSNFGSDVHVAAPGGDLARDLSGDGLPDGVLSTVFDEGGAEPFAYGLAQGTSMAAPHVAGVVALMLGVNPDLTPADIDALLAAGDLTEDIGSSFFFGAGLIDAYAAVATAFSVAGGEPPVNEPRLSVAPGAVQLGVLGTEASLAAGNAGGDGSPLLVLSASPETDDGAAWLAVEADDVDAGGLGSYRVSIDRSGLADGIYTGSIHFDSDANDVDVPVVMQVGTAVPGDADAGRHFVLLVDSESLETLTGVALDAFAGSYRYRFDQVAAGEYLVIAGTDLDNDLFICDAGEACGAFATLDELEPLPVDGDRSDVDFVTGFELRLSGSAAAPASAARRTWRIPAEALK